MMEYAGIDTPRLEAMEERLKKDVLAEVSGEGEGREGEARVRGPRFRMAGVGVAAQGCVLRVVKSRAS